MKQITLEQVKAVRERGTMFVSEMPIIDAFFDNGVNSGMVQVHGIDSIGVLAEVSVVGDPRKYRVCPSDLTIDEATAAHLDAAADMISRFKAAGPITGTYSQGVQHFGRGGSRR